MANFKPEIFTVDEVLAYYELNNTPLYQIFRGTTCTDANTAIDWFDAENGEGGEEQLRQWLDLILKSGNTNVYTFRAVTSFKEVEKKGELKRDCSGKTMIFQLNKPTYNGGIISPVGNAMLDVAAISGNEPDKEGFRTAIELMRQQNEMLREQLNEQRYANINGADDEDVDDDDDEEPAEPVKTPTDKILGAIGNLMENEQVQNFLAMAAIGLLQRLAPKEPAQPIYAPSEQPVEQQQPSNING